MAGGVIHGTASWPGVIAVESCVYTISHGVTPGTAVLRVQPQLTAIPPYGNLTISDGQRLILIRDARMDALKMHQDESGVYWTLEIVDRRWRWRDLGALSGCYNQLDPFGKLIPFTIRSPKELAKICLDAMGEASYVIDFPEGLNYPGPLTSLPITNITGTNPPVNWVGVPPVQALAQLAEQYSLRVILRLSDNTVLVTVPGVGGKLPPGSVHRAGPSLKNPEAPDSIAVLGSPTKYQARLVMRAVGEEWDGSYRPIDELSYAPPKRKDGKSPWITCFPPMFGMNLDGTTKVGIQATQRLTIADALKLAQRSVYKCYQLVNLAGDWSYGIAVPGITGRLIRPQQVVLQDTQVDQIVPTANDLGIIDKFTGQPFTVNLYNGWSRDKPAAAYGAHYKDLNPGVWYKKRAKQVNTLPTDQIFVPFSLDPARYLMTFSDYVYQLVAPKSTPPSPFVPPQTTGSLLDGFGTTTLTFKDDPDPRPDGFIYPTVVTLQTGIFVRDPLTNSPYCYFKVIPTGNAAGTTPRVYSHPDVQLNITCDFDPKNMPVKARILEADPLLRADSYLAAHLAEFLVSGGTTVDYNGIMAIDLDGAVQQVTWSIGGDGATTTASVNSEHSAWIPPYPVRRRAEALPPELSSSPGAGVSDGLVSMPTTTGAPGAAPGEAR